jgi:hypothetical protein
MVGRSAIADSLVLDCLQRGDSDTVVPILFLLGRRGSGKTLLITYVQERLASSGELPYVLIDCEERPQSTAWRLICDVADGLNRKWPRFGRLRFPRTTLGRLAAEHDELPLDEREAKQRLHATLRVAGKRAYTIGLNYFGADWQDGGDGLDTLANLNGLFHSDNPRAAHVLCRALLDDLIDEFYRRRHKYNCTILLDNCEGRSAVEFLNLLTELRRPIDPLLLIATSRLVPQITGLDSLWSLPWEHEKPGLPHLPDTEGVDYKKWQANRRSQSDPACWWYPVWLRDLSWAEVSDIVHHRHAGFIYRLTRGHPWGARHVAKVLSAADIVSPSNDIKLNDLLLREAPRYLLEGLENARPTLARWSAAQNIETAGLALGHGGHPNLYEELVNRLWIVPGRRRHEFRLHPWLRQILLYELAVGADWEDAHRELRQYCGKCKRPMDVAYHSLALDDPNPAVNYLSLTLHMLDADHWIEEFEDLTSAPRLLTRGQKAEERYETMMQERGEDVLANVILSMVAARSIWSNPLGDPTYSLKDTIADGYVRLAEIVTAGSIRYRREAAYYRNLDAQRRHRD